MWNNAAQYMTAYACWRSSNKYLLEVNRYWNNVLCWCGIFMYFSILFVVEIEVVRHEETVASSRYVFFETPCVVSWNGTPSVGTRCTKEEALLAMSWVQWNVTRWWLDVLHIYKHILQDGTVRKIEPRPGSSAVPFERCGPIVVI